jgi:hypothetical protein
MKRSPNQRCPYSNKLNRQGLTRLTSISESDRQTDSQRPKSISPTVSVRRIDIQAGLEWCCRHRRRPPAQKQLLKKAVVANKKATATILKVTQTC